MRNSKDSGSEQLRGRTCCWLGWDGSCLDLLGPAEFPLAEMLEAVGYSGLEPVEEVWARDMNLMELVDLSAFFYCFIFFSSTVIGVREKILVTY